MYRIENYAAKPPFANMLPGVAGTHGIPCWCFTVNRGQAVCSFGVRNKDHAILPFSPMAEALRTVETQGFRTFLLLNDVFYEPFADADVPHVMELELGALHIKERNEQRGLETSVSYAGVPGAKVGGLLRKVTLRNIGNRPLRYQLLDGLATLMPYGVNQWMQKFMGQTVQAWMQVERTEEGLPFFQVRTGVEDSIAVNKVEAGNFAFARDENGAVLLPLIDPAVVFGADTALKLPQGLLSKGISGLLCQPQCDKNRLPCCLFAREGTLQPGEEAVVYALYGQGASMALCDAVYVQYADAGVFEENLAHAAALVEAVTAPIATRTKNPVFDAYCRQTWLDNVLRGGMPVLLGGNKVFHLYSRKHGDIERDYNEFQLSFDYYAQGNGNFRDVCQNRRSDVLFAPFSGEENLRTFLNLVQLDGYNPLVVMPSQYVLKDASAALEKVTPDNRGAAAALLNAPFTPGQLVMAAEGWALEGVDADGWMQLVMGQATAEQNAAFGEGYWSDHWTYLMDMAETYGAVYPERMQKLLFDQENCRYFQTHAYVRPRAQRYCVRENRVRQYTPLDHVEKTDRKWAEDAQGNLLQSTPMEKLLLLCIVKYATLDPYGMGVEMEGGKPGWYDALNGLPGLLGASCAELYELIRLMRFVLCAVKKRRKPIALLAELYELMDTLVKLTQAHQTILMGTGDIVPYWQAANDAKEAYRCKLLRGLSGEKRTIDAGTLSPMLQSMLKVLQRGAEKAVEQNGGLPPTYYYYEADKFAAGDAGVLPLSFVQHGLPLFLEGAVRYMRLLPTEGEKQQLAQRVEESALYDTKLHMYKVNAPLKGVTYEVGRTVAFTPGWLENESVWLHMEYKYLLELLRGGLYDTFAKALRHCAIPFQDPAVYGRSVLENVSFIASSANPDPSCHGRGFVARLSGSTAEFVQMWQWMMIGLTPFFTDASGELCFRPAPFIPCYLMPEDGIVEVVLLGQTKITYITKGCKALVPGSYRITGITLGETAFDTDTLRGDMAHKLRENAFDAMVVYIEECAV